MYTLDSKAFETRKALIDALVEHLQEEFEVGRSYPHGVLLSGGSTPKPVYHAIARGTVKPAPMLHLAYTDERHVLKDDPESNYAMTLPMLEALGLPKTQVLDVKTELSLEEAAARYHDDIAKFQFRGGKFSLALLGLGADGHTCSLFNDVDLDRAQGKLAAPIYKDKPPHRITVSPELLESVEQILFVVAGPDKAEVIKALQEDPESMTAGKAVADCKQVALWYTLS